MLDLTRRTLLAGLLATVAIPAARAGEWPEKPVVWVIPAGPGGPFDAFARPVGAHVTEKLGQSMIIDNRSGAGGTIGAASVARAPADGYTICLHVEAAVAILCTIVVTCRHLQGEVA